MDKHSFKDFLLRIEPQRGEVYPISVLDSPAGAGAGSMTISMNADGVLDLSHKWNDLKRAGLEVPARGERQSQSSIDPKHLGGQLYEALFSDTKILSLLNISLGKVEVYKSILRIKLNMDIEQDVSLARLASLPWELMYRKDKRLFLCQSPNTSVIRSLDVMSSREIEPIEGPLKVLVVTANPNQDLQLEREIQTIRNHLKEKKEFKVHILDSITYESLEKHLDGHDYHIVHYMGHGAYRDGKGMLLFESGEVSGDMLGQLLRKKTNIRLVFLNACNTARMGNQAHEDPFTGVAAALVMAGTPAVVAMQYPISDEAAIVFAGRFYQSLSDGDLIERAVARGRSAILGKEQNVEWVTPVLFKQSDAEDLFKRSTQSTQNVQRAPIQPRSDTESFQEALDIQLQPYMVNRKRILDALSLAINKQNRSKDLPLVCVIHGDEFQCQVNLTNRLRDMELPKKLNYDELVDAVQAYDIEWPKGYQEAHVFHELLSIELADKVRGKSTFTPAEISEWFARMPAVLLHSTIYSTEWKNYPPDSAVEDYLAYWQAWPKVYGQRLIVILYITYKNARPKSKWERLLKKKIKRLM